MRKRAGKPFRLRADRLNEGGECLVLLPTGFRNALLDATDRMHWSRAWLDENYNETELTEAQMSIVELGIGRLIDCVDINIVNNVSCGGCGCGGDGTSVNVIITDDEESGGFTEDSLPPDIQGPLDPGGDVPDTISGNGITTWDDYDVYMCDVSWFIAELLPRFLRIIETMSDKLSTILVVASVLATIFPGAWLLKSGVIALVELLGAITDVLVFELAFDNLVELAEYLEEPARQEAMACAIYDNRYSLPGARSALLTQVQQYIFEVLFDGTAQEKVLTLIDKVLPLRWYYHQILKDVFSPIQKGRNCENCTDPGGEVYDYQDTQHFNTNDPDPFTLGLNAVLHQDVFYNGDGHIGLRSAGSNISFVTTTNTDWCNKYFIDNPTAKIMKKIVVTASLTTDHGAQPPSGGLRITALPGQVGEQTFDFDPVATDLYTDYVVIGDFSWDIGDDAEVVKIEQVNSSTFQAELKIGEVQISLDNA